MPRKRSAPVPSSPAQGVPPASAGGGGRATIADVARLAGVSKATVSRVLNQRDALLTPDIAARVRTAIEALSYVPSPMAQGLKRGRTKLIGLVVADITNPYSVAVLRGIEQACQEAGYLVVLFNLGNERGRERQAIEALSAYQVEGFILNRVGEDAAVMGELASAGRPMVLVDRRYPALQADFVSLDNGPAMRMAVEHLREAGCQDLLFVTEPLRDVSSRSERDAAFRACVRELGLAGSVFEHAGEDEAALDAALRQARAAAGGRRPAVIAGNSVSTLRVARAVARLGWSFGAELAFVGFDDTDWAPLLGPGLTTIEQPTAALGRAAADCLIRRLQGDKAAPREILLPGRLRIRGSSRPR